MARVHIDMLHDHMVNFALVVTEERLTMLQTQVQSLVRHQVR